MSSFDFEYWHIKIIFDLAGYLSGGIAAWYMRTWISQSPYFLDPFSHYKHKQYDYYLLVIAGAFIFAILVSTLDGYLLGRAQTEQGIILSKSIAGALFGGVLTAEIYKKIHNIQGSTGIILLPGIMIGLFIGRFGAIATGIRDFTYGTPTHLPWGMDFGDGILRHPTMIYEMILLISLGCIILGTFRKYESFWIKNGFYVFILVYFIYRFFVGFIQPYSTWWIGLSTYQVIAIPMVFYSIHFFKNINHSYAKQK